MKESIKFICITAIFLITSSNLFSTPLNGTYTIGSGGNYPTINSAFNEAAAQGIKGPVIFEIITGTYNEEVVISFIPGSSSINTVTLKSQSGNPADVLINGVTNVFNISSADIVIAKISIGSSASNSIQLYGVNIKFIDNYFNNGSLVIYPDYTSSYIFVSGNKNIGNLNFQGADFGFYNQYIDIKNNTFAGNIFMIYCRNVLIENNNISGGIGTVYFSGSIIKNNITSNLESSGYIYNNFIRGTVTAYYSDLRNNTIVGGSSSSPAIIYNGNGYSILSNNIVINPFGGPALSSIYDINISGSDHNDFYNGGNNNLINFGGISYNTVTEFYNATGFDQHSTSQPVSFFSPADLHLSFSSLGDEQLIGVPDPLINDDIDGQPRSLTYPYKGADEAVDHPLPAELASFTSSVNDNNVNLNWTTSSETNNSGFDVERSKVKGQTSDEWIKIDFVHGHGTTTTPNNYEFTDKNLSSGKYKYRLKQIDFNGNFEYHNLADEVVIGVPEKFSLEQNYPNPFNPSTVIRYSLSENSYVTLKVYDVIGNEVATLVRENQNSGTYNYQFSTVNYQLSSGVYFYKIETRSFSSIKKMTLIK